MIDYNSSITFRVFLIDGRISEHTFVRRMATSSVKEQGKKREKQMQFGWVQTSKTRMLDHDLISFIPATKVEFTFKHPVFVKLWIDLQLNWMKATANPLKCIVILVISELHYSYLILVTQVSVVPLTGQQVLLKIPYLVLRKHKHNLVASFLS